MKKEFLTTFLCAAYCNILSIDFKNNIYKNKRTFIELEVNFFEGCFKIFA